MNGPKFKVGQLVQWERRNKGTMRKGVSHYTAKGKIHTIINPCESPQPKMKALLAKGCAGAMSGKIVSGYAYIVVATRGKGFEHVNPRVYWVEESRFLVLVLDGTSKRIDALPYDIFWGRQLPQTP